MAAPPNFAVSRCAAAVAPSRSIRSRGKTPVPKQTPTFQKSYEGLLTADLSNFPELMRELDTTSPPNVEGYLTVIKEFNDRVSTLAKENRAFPIFRKPIKSFGAWIDRVKKGNDLLELATFTNNCYTHFPSFFNKTNHRDIVGNNIRFIKS